jgi:hypothetical protein
MLDQKIYVTPREYADHVTVSGGVLGDRVIN